MGKTALVLGGGAPNATLMSGALSVFAEAGVHFDVISTAGAGALIGLLYLAPGRGLTPAQALRSTIEMGIADAIYDHYPVNYKVFQKPGAVADAFRALVAANPMAQALEQQYGDSAMAKLFGDWMKLLVASACPTDLSPKSLGLCASVPFLEETVDFDALRASPTGFYVNAYNITERRMQNFRREVITADHCRAALAYPFLYPPFPIRDPDTDKECLYYEGAAHDCLNYKALVEHEPEVTRIVVFDVLGADALMRAPRDLYDAWLLSIIVPTVAIAQDDTKLFKALYNHDPERELFQMPFVIPEEHLPYALDWSRSNLETLFHIGEESARAYLAGEGSTLLA